MTVIYTLPDAIIDLFSDAPNEVLLFTSEEAFTNFWGKEMPFEVYEVTKKGAQDGDS